jgi:hypothetical protein
MSDVHVPETASKSVLLSMPRPVPSFESFILSIIKSMDMTKLADALISVQPMLEPAAGQAFYMDMVYGQGNRHIPGM